MSGEYTLALQDIHKKLDDIKRHDDKFLELLDSLGDLSLVGSLVKHVATDRRVLLEQLALTEKALDWAVNHWVVDVSIGDISVPKELMSIFIESRERGLTKGVENDKGHESKAD